MKKSRLSFTSLGVAITVGAALPVLGFASPTLDQKSTGTTLNCSKPPKTPGPIVLGLTTDKRVYGVGEPILANLTAANKTTAPITLTFTSTKRSDFVIYRVKGAGKEAVAEKAPLWRWSQAKMFGMIVMTDALGPEKPFKFSVTIDPTKFPEGAKLDKGAYHLEGFLTPSQAQFSQPSLSATVDFVVK